MLKLSDGFNCACPISHRQEQTNICVRKQTDVLPKNVPLVRTHGRANSSVQKSTPTYVEKKNKVVGGVSVRNRTDSPTPDYLSWPRSSEPEDWTKRDPKVVVRAVVKVNFVAEFET